MQVNLVISRRRHLSKESIKERLRALVSVISTKIGGKIGIVKEFIDPVG